MLVKFLPWIAGAAIIVASVGLSAFQLKPILGQPPVESVIAPISNSQDSVRSNSDQRDYDIASFQIFGELNAAEPTIEQALEDIPETRLRLTLTGVSAAQEQSLARALIEGPDRKTESYRVGDSLPGNASLHSVHADRVVLSRSGKLETLFFPEISSASRLLSSVVENPSTQGQAQADDFDEDAQNFQPAVQIPEGLPRITPAQKKSIRDKLSALRSRLNNQ